MLHWLKAKGLDNLKISFFMKDYYKLSKKIVYSLNIQFINFHSPVKWILKNWIICQMLP